jgi:hypothetical protein
MADSKERPIPSYYLAVLATGCALLTAACTSGSPAPAPTGRSRVAPSATSQSGAATAPASNAARYTSGGCGATRLRLGGAPRWAASANPPRIPYALAAQGKAAGFLFGNPLRAGHPENPDNKILWVVALPRDGSPLRLTAHPVGATAPVFSSTWPDNSAPGEIYPSIVNVPVPGCWHFTLTWNGHSDAVDLRYIRQR